MTLSEFYDREGLAGLRRVAEQSGTRLSYMRTLLYSADKMPSLKMAVKMVRASGGMLTYEGLANPVARRREDEGTA